MSAFDELAERFGIEASFVDARGETKETSLETKRALLAALGAEVNDEAAARAELERRDEIERRRALPPVIVAHCGESVAVPAEWRVTLEDGSARAGSGALPVDLPIGYHTLRLHGPESAECSLIVAPERCYVPDELRECKAWGLAVQLYLLRSQTNWGIGDFTDLQTLTAMLAERGADVVGLNPLHAMFLDNPEHASPYSPESRLLLNVLNIDVTAVPEFAASARARRHCESAEFGERLAAARGAEDVRYADAAALKLPVLRMLFEERPAEGARADAFSAFVRDRGEVLRRGSLFQLLRSHFAESGTTDWRSWPEDYRDPSAGAVDAFAREHDDELTFLMWLQFIADEQLGRACAAAEAMRVGLYRDLAVGADPNGAEVWSNHAAVVATASVGAPPDIYNAAGQNWGLPPFHPLALREEGYRSFIDLVRANMRHAGAIRIDHVMALQHLYLIPAGASPADGAYVRYPLDDLLGILALESARRRCLVIGEDLGTVPAGFRDRMAAANVLSYRVLFFETDPDSGAFVPPDRYPELSLAVVSSHDLPTLRAWWHAYDADLKLELGLIDAAAADELRRTRARQREALTEALVREGLLAEGDAGNDDAVGVAVHAYLGRTQALLAMAQIDDVTAETEPVNVPATTDERPNWRRRISTRLGLLRGDARFRGIAEAFARAGRGRTAAV